MPPRNLKMTTSRSMTSKTSFSRAASRSGSVTPKPMKVKQSSPAPHLMEVTRKPSSKPVSPANSSLSLSMSSDHLCAHCGSANIQSRQVTRSFGKGSALLLIEGIPMWACSNCGETYFSAQTLHEIERIKTLRKSVAVKRSVPVAEFQ